MNELDCIKRMADHYPGGLKAVALRLDISHEVLRKQLAGAHGFKLGLIDAMAIVRMCADHNTEYAGLFAAAACEASHMRAVTIASAEADAGDVFDQVGDSVDAGAAWTRAVITHISDGDVCDNDMKAIEKALAAHVDKKHRLMRTVRTMHRQGKRGRGGK